MKFWPADEFKYALELPNEEDEETEERDQPIDFFLRARTMLAQDLIATAIEHTLSVEIEEGLRKKRRSAAVDRQFRQTASFLIANVVYQQLSQGSPSVMTPRAKKDLTPANRYRPIPLTHAYPEDMDLLCHPAVGLLEKRTGSVRAGKVTTLSAGPKLLELLEQTPLHFDDFESVGGGETIELKGPKFDYRRKERLDYADTDQTHAMRARMNAVNAWLAEADLAFILNSVQVDTRRRRLKRVFSNGSFDQGGRLFGGFWQGLSKAVRKAGLQINGEPTAELDYGQCMIRILYGIHGTEPPLPDCYAIPGFEGSRDGVKKVVASLLFSTKPLERFPRDVKKYFSKKTRLEQVVLAIESAHPDLVGYFGAGIGHQLQHVESEILLEVLERLRTQQVVALPIHDAVVVAVSDTEAARQTMEAVFLEKAGIQAIVDVILPDREELPQ